jgi:AcrR family transcriptional regulator
MGITERKERDRQEMRSLILEAALNLFHHKGYENITLRQIAQKIEYSPATIYLYFKDKDEIFFELHNEGFDKLYQIQLSLSSIIDPIKRLHKHSEEYIRFALENPEYYDIMFIMRCTALKIKEKKVWEAGGRSYQYLKQNVQECINNGYFKDIHPEVATFTMWSFVHGIASLCIRGRSNMIPKEFLDKIIDGSRDLVYSMIISSKK